MSTAPALAFRPAKAHLVHAHAMLAGAGAAIGQGAGHQLVVQGFGDVAFFGMLGSIR